MPTILPFEWKRAFTSNDNVLFDSLDHFVYTVAKLTQKVDDKCGVSYAQALSDITRRKSDFPKEDQHTVRNLVRNNLLKRGLITQEIYESYKYTNGSEGANVGVDIGKYCAGEPDCVLTPSRQYVDFFYELYISISYSGNTPDSYVRDNVAKLLATVEELERKRIFVKINTVLPIEGAARINSESRNFFSLIPVFSHKDFKNVELMSSVVNEKLLRKFYFAVLEDLYGSDINYGYGYTVDLPKTINIGGTLNEVELFESIVKDVTKGAGLID